MFVHQTIMPEAEGTCTASYFSDSSSLPLSGLAIGKLGCRLRKEIALRIATTYIANAATRETFPSGDG